jgi:DNA invertase Pin-like site-specific DNA recombinase
MKIGFARVSTNKQDLDIQLKVLNKVPCDKIFHIKASGKSSKNDEKLQEVIDYVRDEDVVYVTKLNRLARSTRKILNAINLIHNKKACLITLDGAINTSDKNLFSDAMISICATFSQLDRDLIIERTTEGREAAKAAGKHMGRAPSLDKEQTDEIIK